MRGVSAKIILIFILICSSVPAAAEDGAERRTNFPALAQTFRRRCVQVSVYGKSDDGELPPGAMANDILAERPSRIGGFWWDERHVLVPDPVVQDRFIDRIEVSLPGSAERYPARRAGHFVKLRAALLEVLPGPDGRRPVANPLEFTDAELADCALLSYAWDNGEWRVASRPAPTGGAISDAGTETMRLEGEGVLVTPEGRAAGLAFGDVVKVEKKEEGESYWFGAEAAHSPFRSAEEAERAGIGLSRRLERAALQVRFRVRREVEEEDDEVALWFDEATAAPRSGDAADFPATGFVAGETRLFVPLAMTPDGIARITEITVTLPDGGEVPARFIGALRKYLAVIIETDADLPVDGLPPGFRLLAADASPETEVAAPPPEFSLFDRVRVDHSLGRRREVREYDRWLGVFSGYRDDNVVLTLTNEADGSLAFDLAGNLAAIALSPRVLATDAGAAGTQGPGFRPLAALHNELARPDALDPVVRPVAESAGQRRIDFGAECQPLDAGTARLFGAARASRGGEIGLLVTHVYPGSLAEGAGIREHDVLLRMRLDGRAEPVELRGGENGGYQDYFTGGDTSAEALGMMFSIMPPPWPTRDDAVARLLTAAGPGLSAEVEFLREGESRQAAFTTAYAEADYRSAERERFRRLGLTAKPLTYEVRRFFRRDDAGGVVVSRVEEGGAAAVGGLHRYLLVTHVNGEALAGLTDFKEKLAGFENGGAAEVELTAEIFGQTRLVKIRDAQQEN